MGNNPDVNIIACWVENRDPRVKHIKSVIFVQSAFEEKKGLYV
jgi:hypothetical protein